MKTGWHCLALALSVMPVGEALARPLKEIRKSKELRVCYSDTPGVVELFPKGCRNDCKEAKGISWQITELVGKKFGFKPKIVGIDWDEHFWGADNKTHQGETYQPLLFANGTCDVFPTNLTRLEWRERLMGFATVFSSRMMVLVRKEEQAKYQSVESLAGKSTTVEASTSYLDWLQQGNKAMFLNNPIKITTVQTDTSIQDLIDKKIDFAIWDIDVAFWHALNTSKNIVVRFPVGPVDEVGWGVDKQDPDLTKLLQDFFSTSRKDPKSELNKMWKKYYGVDLIEMWQMVNTMK